MDLTLNVEDYKLNIRAAGIIIHDNKVLVHKNINKDHYGLLGGRVSIGESSNNTIVREIKEELGKDVEIVKYLTTVENFFETSDSKFHEILFVYQLEFSNNEDKDINYTLKNIEGKNYLQYEWLDIDKIKEYNIAPNCMQELLMSSNHPIHKIIL